MGEDWWHDPSFPTGSLAPQLNAGSGQGQSIPYSRWDSNPWTHDIPICIPNFVTAEQLQPICMLLYVCLRASLCVCVRVCVLYMHIYLHVSTGNCHWWRQSTEDCHSYSVHHCHRCQQQGPIFRTTSLQHHCGWMWVATKEGFYQLAWHISASVSLL